MTATKSHLPTSIAYLNITITTTVGELGFSEEIYVILQGKDSGFLDRKFICCIRLTFSFLSLSLSFRENRITIFKIINLFYTLAQHSMHTIIVLVILLLLLLLLLMNFFV